MSIVRRLGVLAAITVATPGTTSAGAWTQARGTLYQRTSSSQYTSTSEFDVDSERQDLPFQGEFVDLNVSAYLELGVADRVTTVGSFVAKRLRSENQIQETKTWGIGDVDVGLRARLVDGGWGVVSLQAMAKLPTGYDERSTLPLGNGEPEVEARLLYGRSLWPLVPGYVGVEAGYRGRRGAPEDEVRYLAEVGSDLGTDFYLRSKLDGVHGVATGIATDASGNPTVRNSYDLGTLEVIAGWRVVRSIALEGGMAGGLYGRTTSAGTTVTLAVAFTFTGLFGDRGEPGGGAAG